MWRDVFMNNREAVLEMLGRFTEDLSRLQRAIRWGEADVLEELFTRTRDVRRGRDIAARIHAGTVNVNEGYAAAWGSVAAPMGGMKSSGLGRRHGREGLLKYTESQNVTSQHVLGIAPRSGSTPGCDGRNSPRFIFRTGRATAPSACGQNTPAWPLPRRGSS